MTITALDFILRAKECPLGKDLASAGTVDRVIDLMRDEDVDDKEIKAHAQEIFDAKQEFIQNVGFSVPLFKPKY